jgi:hypothetical protein
MPLYYSLCWERAAVPHTSPELAADARDLATAIEDSVTKVNLDPGGQIRELLSELRALTSAA